MRRYTVALILLGLIVLALPVYLLAQTALPPPPTPTLVPVTPYPATPTPHPPRRTPFPTTTLVPTNAAPTSSTIQFGETLTETLPVGNVQHSYTFIGEVGQVIGVQLKPTNHNPGFELRDQNGYGQNQLAWTGNTAIFLLPGSGSYSIVVNPYYNYVNNAEEYTLSLASLSVQPISYGDIVEAQLTEAQAVGLYLFNAQAGDPVHIAAQGAGFHPVMILATETQQLINSNYTSQYQVSGGSTIDYFILPETRAYMVIVQASNNHLGEGDYRLSLTKVQPTAIELDGETVQGTFTAYNQHHFYSFDGAYGEVVDFNIASDDGVDVAVHVYVANTGEQVAFDDDSGAGLNPEVLGMLLNRDAQYVVKVQSVAVSEAGDYTLNVSTSDDYTLNATPRSFTFQKRSQQMVSFGAQAGELIRLNVAAESGGLPFINIAQEDSHILNITPTQIGEVSAEFRVPNDGVVLVTVNGQTQSYLRVTPVEIWIERLVTE